MTKKLILFFSIVLIAGFFALPFVGNAMNVKSEDIVDWQGETDGNFYAVGTSVNIDGKIKGDVFAAGQIINISGEVDGDVFAAGSQIIVDGNIKGNIRIAGSVMEINGNVERNVLAAGTTLTIGESANVVRHLTFAGSVLEIDGPVGGNLESGASSLILNNSIGGRADVEVSGKSGGAFRLTENAEVSGDLNYKSVGEADISPEAKINGEVNFKKFDGKRAHKEGMMKRQFNKFISFANLVKFLAAFLIGLLFILGVPKLADKFRKKMESSFWINFGVGLLWFFVTPIAAIFLMFTLVGIPLAVISVVMWAIFFYFSKILAAMVIGRVITEAIGWKNLSLWISFLIGLVIISLVTLIPFFGWIAVWVVCVWAFGAGAQMDMEMIKKWH